MAIEHLTIPATQHLVESLLGVLELSEDGVRQVVHAAAHIDERYETRRARNHDGRWIDVTNSPVPSETGRFLAMLVVAERAMSTLEIGLSFGMSACHILLGQRLVGGESRHVAVDPFQHSEYYQGCGLVNVAEAGLGRGFRWLEARSDAALPQLVGEGLSIDLCFIDGSHLFGDIFIDAHFCDRLLRPRGLMVFDDAWLPATRTVANIMVTNYGYVQEPSPEAPNVVVLRRPAAPQGDWKDFAEAFVPFAMG